MFNNPTVNKIELKPKKSIEIVTRNDIQQIKDYYNQENKHIL